MSHHASDSAVRSGPRAQGDVDFGKYQSLVRLGRGGMAEVFLTLARGHGGFNKLVVVKSMLPSVANDDSFREMFLQEARLAARLNHPNVVQTYEASEDGGRLFLAMEYLQGQPLNRLATALATSSAGGEPRVHPALFARIIADALAGLHHAHELGDYDGTPLRIVHRDVSPQNIFVTYDGYVKVLDFGIAKAEIDVAKTQRGMLKGKAGYMAPEQLSPEPIDRRVDIFVAGIVLWEMLTGRRLMNGPSTATTLAKLLHEPIPRLTDVLETIDPRLDAIVFKALQRNRDNRYSTALEMRQALEAYLATVPAGVGATAEELGQRVSALFAKDREGIRDQIREQLSSAQLRHASGAPSGGMTVAASPIVIETPMNLQISLPTPLPLAARSRSPLWGSVAGVSAVLTILVFVASASYSARAPKGSATGSSGGGTITQSAATSMAKSELRQAMQAAPRLPSEGIDKADGGLPPQGISPHPPTR